ncbi:MAG: thiol-disulfide isomerase/thioredoxin [Phenylobacterium sp.]|jgi:thiol-disulfide isomerase/thioredoxin
MRLVGVKVTVKVIVKVIALSLMAMISFSTLALTAAPTKAAAPAAKIIPSQIKHQDFLLDPYKPGAPSVVVFKDPYCGYCIKALQRLDRLSEYNVYMFWAGILGDRSVKKVEQIMNCAAPISNQVFNSVIQRSELNCEQGMTFATQHLKALNDEMVGNYQPNSVPSYHFGGRKVYVSQLDKFKNKLRMNITPIQLQWQRYSSLRVANTDHQGLANAIVFLPKESVKREYLIDALKKDNNYSWYLVEDSCVATGKGNSGADCTKQQKLAQELRLLLDVTDASASATVVNGTVINPLRYKQYFSAGLSMMLASK